MILTPAVEATKSGDLLLDGERYAIEAGCTFWSPTFVREAALREPTVREFFRPTPLAELEAAFAILDAAKRGEVRWRPCRGLKRRRLGAALNQRRRNGCT